MMAIKEYENNKWKVIGQKVSKPAKACEQYAKEHFPGTTRAQQARVNMTNNKQSCLPTARDGKAVEVVVSVQ
jgi:hypothetical protein